MEASGGKKINVKKKGDKKAEKSINSLASFYHLRILQFILLHTTSENSASSVC